MLDLWWSEFYNVWRSQVNVTPLPWSDGCDHQAEVKADENWTETMGFGQEAVTGYLFKRVVSLEKPDCKGLRKESKPQTQSIWWQRKEMGL